MTSPATSSTNDTSISSRRIHAGPSTCCVPTSRGAHLSCDRISQGPSGRRRTGRERAIRADNIAPPHGPPCRIDRTVRPPMSSVIAAEVALRARFSRTFRSECHLNAPHTVDGMTTAQRRNFNEVITRFWSFAAPAYDLPFLQQWVYRPAHDEMLPSWRHTDPGASPISLAAQKFLPTASSVNYGPPRSTAWTCWNGCSPREGPVDRGDVVDRTGRTNALRRRRVGHRRDDVGVPFLRPARGVARVPPRARPRRRGGGVDTPVATTGRRVRPPGRGPQHTRRRSRRRCRCLPEAMSVPAPTWGEHRLQERPRRTRPRNQRRHRRTDHRTRTAYAGTLPGTALADLAPTP